MALAALNEALLRCYGTAAVVFWWSMAMPLARGGQQAETAKEYD
jgi:hypothetical protein